MLLLQAQVSQSSEIENSIRKFKDEIAFQVAKLKSDNVQYNMLDRWDNKCLMLQALSFFHNFLQICNFFAKDAQFIFSFSYNLVNKVIDPATQRIILKIVGFLSQKLVKLYYKVTMFML